MSNEEWQEEREALLSWVAHLIRRGHLPLEEIPRYCISIDPDTGFAESDIELMVEESLARIREEQRTWPRVTDCDRLAAAFARLEGGGIATRQDYLCCTRCGHTHLIEEILAARAKGAAIWGYTFFHGQDTDLVMEGKGLFLAFGAVEEDDGEYLAVGRRVVGALQSEGLNVSWEGTVNRRIYMPMTWQKRVSLPTFN